MFSDAKWARFVAERGRPGMDGPPPDELHVVPAQYTHRQAPQFRGVTGVPAISFDVTWAHTGVITAAGTSNLQAPRDGGSFAPWPTIAVDPLFTFAPGIYRYEGYCRDHSGSTSNTLRWYFLGGDSTGVTLATYRPFPGATQIWSASCTMIGGGGILVPFSGEIYAPGRWMACLVNVGATAVTDSYSGYFSVLPVYVFDEGGAT